MAASPHSVSNDAERRVDPILFEVIRNALVEVTEEMSVSLQRTAFSTNVKTRLDYSSAFVDAEGRMVAQAFCQPAHLITIGRLVPRAVAEYGAENLAPGDMLVVNDPHRQASHLNDIFLIAPVYHGGERVGYLSNICHHVDVGGGAPASIGAFRETYQEGIILPVVKLVAEGAIDAGLWKMILANVRAKKEVAGDLRAQISANNLGLRRLAAVLDRYGLDTVRFYTRYILDYTEKRTRAELAKLPCGTFEAEGWLDDDGMSDRPVHLKARITLDGCRAVFDFSGTDPQRWAPMNCNMTQTFTACVFVLKCLIDPDVPLNEGFYQVLEVTAPEGSAVNARHPGAIVGGWEVSTRLCEVLFKALSPAMPDKVPAGTKGMICHVGFGGEDPRTGDYYTFLENDGRRLRRPHPLRRPRCGADQRAEHPERAGGGDRAQLPGAHPALQPDPRLRRAGPVPGRPGAVPASTCSRTTSRSSPPSPTAPGSLPGGCSAAGTDARRATSPSRTAGAAAIPSKGTAPVASGTVIRVETCGGGGYGPAWDRDPEQVLRDVFEEKISAERAREVYGVVIDASGGSVDVAGTDERRRALRVQANPS